MLQHIGKSPQEVRSIVSMEVTWYDVSLLL
jgi:hypothetical protein